MNATQRTHCPLCREPLRAPNELVLSGAHTLGCSRCYCPRRVKGPYAVKQATPGYTLRRVA